MLRFKSLLCSDVKDLWRQVCLQLCLCNLNEQMFFFNLIFGWLHHSRTSMRLAYMLMGKTKLVLYDGLLQLFVYK